MSHEDVLLIVDAIHHVAWAVFGAQLVLVAGIVAREFRR